MGENIKTTKKHFSKLGGYFCLGTIVIFSIQLAALAVLGLVKPEWAENGDISLIFSMAPMYIVGMPFLIWLVKTLPAKAPEKRKMSAGQVVLAAIMCYAVMFVSNLTGIAITAVIGLVKGSMVQNTMADVAVSSNLLLLFIYTVICAPIFEEYIFRKLIIDSTVRYGQGIAIMLSGLMFALFHGNLNQFVYAFTLGLFFAFLYVRTGNLKIVILLHMFINFMGGVVSTLVLRLIDMQEYMNAVNSGEIQNMMMYFQDNVLSFMIYMGYLCIVFCLVITGIVLLIVFRKKFRLQKAAPVQEILPEGNIYGAHVYGQDFPEEARVEQECFPRGKRFSIVILNPGMAAYCVFWLVMIVIQLFM